MNKAKFKIGDYVKQNPTGIVKKIIAVEEPDPQNRLDKSYWYKLEDSFGWEPEYKLTIDKKENLSMSYDKAQEVKIERLEEKLKAEREKVALLRSEISMAKSHYRQELKKLNKIMESE